MRYSLATNWDSNLTQGDNFKSKNKKNKVIEFFASFNNFTAIPSKDISKKDFIKKVKEIKEEGYNFNYILNSSFKIANKKLFVSAMLIKELKVDIVTLANIENISFFRKNFPEIRINLSIVNGVDNLVKTKKVILENSNIKRITFSQKLNRNKKVLKDIIEYCHNFGVEVELLANELCFLNCPYIEDHYKLGSKIALSKNNNIRLNDYFSSHCNSKRIKSPQSFLNTAWIRPEDVTLYEDLGVDVLKIAGRSLKTSYLIKTANAYLNKSYRGNVMDLFSSDWWPESKKPFIENKSLNGLLEYIWSKNEEGKVNKINIAKTFNLKYK